LSTPHRIPTGARVERAGGLSAGTAPQNIPDIPAIGAVNKFPILGLCIRLASISMVLERSIITGNRAWEEVKQSG